MPSVLTSVIERLQSPEYLEGMAPRVTSLVQKNMKEGGWKENAPLTIANKGGDKPLFDDGELYASVASRVDGDRILCAPNRVYAQIVHDGGTLRPTKTKYLTIPAGKETRKLMRQFGATPRTCIEGMKKAGYDVFFRGGAVLYLSASEKKKKTPKAKCLFILKTSVVVPSRPFLRLPESYLAILRRYTTNYLLGR